MSKAWRWETTCLTQAEQSSKNVLAYQRRGQVEFIHVSKWLIDDNIHKPTRSWVFSIPGESAFEENGWLIDKLTTHRYTTRYQLGSNRMKMDNQRKLRGCNVVNTSDQPTNESIVCWLANNLLNAVLIRVGWIKVTVDLWEPFTRIWRYEDSMWHHLRILII